MSALARNAQSESSCHIVLTHKRFISYTMTVGLVLLLPFSAASLMPLSTTRWATSAAWACCT